MRDCKFKRLLIPIYEYLYAAADNLKKWFTLRTLYRLRIMNSFQTIKYIKKHHCSVARYGDGELSFALNIEHQIAFQNSSDTLSERLKSVLRDSDNPELLICMPLYLNSLQGCTSQCKQYWWEWGKENNNQKNLVEFIRDQTGRNYRFGDTQITRPYMDRQNYKYAHRIFSALKEIWNDKDILIVEGEKTRLGVGNNLFDGAKKIERILCPAVNAFEKYESIKNCIVSCYTGQLIIIALGPTATVLAADLCDLGMQALDVGHVDIEYEWFLHHATEKIAIKGKFTNESIQGRNVMGCDDLRYLNQVVYRIETDDIDA